ADGGVWLRTDERPPPADASGVHRRRGRERDPDWLRNLAVHPRCEIRVGQARISAVYERSTDPEADLRRIVELMREKYGGDRVVTEGEADGAAAVVFVIDTPGGLIDSTYQITARFLSAKVPIVTFVAPQGARAASAGTFITMAGNIAAMAPATNIGAAHPVDSNGADIQGDLRTKIENDAVAHIVNIAKARGRNEQWAEDAVRKSVSARVDEALAQNVVDLQANDVPDLAAKMDGRTAKTAAGDVVLATKAAPIEDDALNPIESLLHFVVDPQIAVLLFTLGTYGLIFALSN